MPNKLCEHVRVVKESDRVTGTVKVLMQMTWLIAVVLEWRWDESGVAE